LHGREDYTDTVTQAGQERRDEIIRRVVDRGHVDVRDLARAMGVSEATVRRDLRALAEARQVDLVYGGATLPRRPDASIRSRALRNVEAKRVVGKLAADLVGDHEMLYVDGGTTCFEMRHALKFKHGLSVIVNSWRLAVELGDAPEVNIIQLGGHYRQEREDVVGPLAAQSVDQLRGYVAFISADGLSTDFGLWSNDVDTAYLYEHVVRNARDTVLLVDHTKFQTPSLFRICGWDHVSRVVTDREPDGQWKEFFSGHGISLICPESVAGPAEAVPEER